MERTDVMAKNPKAAPARGATTGAGVPASPGPPEPGGSPGSRLRRLGLVGGPGLFALMRVLPGPGALSDDAWTAAAVGVLMAVWWLTEAVPIPVTALLPLVLFPITGLASMQDAAAPYANEVIFLFMGGFFMAMTMERWEVHRRIALAILGRIGTSPTRLVLGFMAATGFISMWINNTATTAMMLPIALAVGAMFQPPRSPEEPREPYHFGIALMLGIAYASSIGGVATLIGTAPNALFAAAAAELAGVEVGFLEWMLVGVPVAWVMIPLAWLILIRIHPPGRLRGDADAVLEHERARMGPPGRGERFVTAVFALTVLAWILRSPKDLGAFTIPGIATFLPGVTDGTIAMMGALVLFVTPLDRRGEVALDWATASRIPWGVLLLFGGGLSLAAAMADTGLARWIGESVSALSGAPRLVVVAAAATLFIFLTELTSNTAVTAMAMPVMAGVAVTLGVPPVALMATVAMACSMAFMLPAGTPPNAIVFSSGYLTIGQMAWAGIWVNLLAVVIVTLAGAFVMPELLGP